MYGPWVGERRGQNNKFQHLFSAQPSQLYDIADKQMGQPSPINHPIIFHIALPTLHPPLCSTSSVPSQWYAQVEIRISGNKPHLQTWWRPSFWNPQMPRMQECCICTESIVSATHLMSEICLFLSIFSLWTLSSHEWSSFHTCSHLLYAPTTCCSPLSYFIFTIHTKSKPSRRQVKSIRTSIKDRNYLLTRLFTWNLLPSDTISQGFAKQQLCRPLFDELVMRC